MVLPYPTNNMKIRDKEYEPAYLRRAILCIAFGTGLGLFVYEIFLFFKIDIFGWNLGLIFAPLAAGYAETMLANKILGEDIGAISAFILFVDTTFYSFILKNPTLGLNIITAGSILVILQAAFPTLVNYILLVLIGGFITHFLTSLKKIEKAVSSFMIEVFKRYKADPDVDLKIKAVPFFDEKKSNEHINSLDFFFITSTDVIHKKHEIVGNYQTNIIIKNDRKLVHLEHEVAEKEFLTKIKEGKDECLIRLVEEVRKNSGNGVVNLKIEYGLIGLGGDIQISTIGMGVRVY